MAVNSAMLTTCGNISTTVFANKNEPVLYHPVKNESERLKKIDLVKMNYFTISLLIFENTIFCAKSQRHKH